MRQTSPPNPLNTVLGPLNKVAALACGYVLLFLALALSVEIIARKFFLISLQGIDDLGGYALAFSASIGASYALFNKNHTRVDMLLAQLSGPAQRYLNAFAMLCMAALALFSAWRCSIVLFESIEFQSIATNPLQTPMWQPQGIWLAGIYIFALTASCYAVHVLWLLWKKKPGINAWYGLSNSAVKEEFNKGDTNE